jgi:hypothetical protein
MVGCVTNWIAIKAVNKPQFGCVTTKNMQRWEKFVTALVLAAITSLIQTVDWRCDLKIFSRQSQEKSKPS